AGDGREVDVLERGRSLAHRLGLRPEVEVLRFPRVVEHVDGDCLAADVLHDDVADGHVLHGGAASAFGLDANAAVVALKHAVGNRDPLHAPRHLAADHHAAVPVEHGAIGDGVVLGGATDAPALLVATRLDGDTVIPGVDVALRDVHVPARIGVDAVGIGRT